MSLLDQIKLWILEHPQQWDILFPVVATALIVLPLVWWWAERRKKTKR